MHFKALLWLLTIISYLLYKYNPFTGIHVEIYQYTQNSYALIPVTVVSVHQLQLLVAEFSIYVLQKDDPAKAMYSPDDTTIAGSYFYIYNMEKSIIKSYYKCTEICYNFDQSLFFLSCIINRHIHTWIHTHIHNDLSAITPWWALIGSKGVVEKKAVDCRMLMNQKRRCAEDIIWP